MRKIILSDSLPAYRQVADYIKHMILYGELASGHRISMRKLMKDYGVSKSVSENALESLKDEGIIQTIPKVGSFVTREARTIVSCKPSPDWETLSSRGLHKSYKDIIKMLTERYAEGNLKYRHEHSFYPADFHPYDYISDVLEEFDAAHIIRMMNKDDKYGHREARQAIMTYSKNYGIHTNLENIVLFNNAIQAYNAIVFSFLGHGSNLYCAKYDATGCNETISTTGANKYWLECDSEGIIPEEIEKKIRSRNSMLYLCPQNHYPTGKTMSARRREEILDLCRLKQIPVIENAMTKDLWRTTPPRPLKSQDDHDIVFYMDSFTTTFNTGYQCAWVIAPSSSLLKLNDISQQVYGNYNKLNEYLISIILNRNFYYNNMKFIRKVNSCRLERIEKALEEHLGGIARWVPENIDYHIWLEFDSRINIMKLFADCPGYLFFPGPMFGNSNHLLLNAVCESVERTIDCIKAIRNAVKKQTC